MNGFDRLSNLIVGFRIFSELINDIQASVCQASSTLEIKENENTPKQPNIFFFANLILRCKSSSFFPTGWS